MEESTVREDQFFLVVQVNSSLNGSFDYTLKYETEINVGEWIDSTFEYKKNYIDSVEKSVRASIIEVTVTPPSEYNGDEEDINELETYYEG